MYHVFITDVAVCDGNYIEEQLYRSHYLVILDTPSIDIARQAVESMRKVLPFNSYVGILTRINEWDTYRLVVESTWGTMSYN